MARGFLVSVLVSLFCLGLDLGPVSTYPVQLENEAQATEGIGNARKTGLIGDIEAGALPGHWQVTPLYLQIITPMLQLILDLVKVVILAVIASRIGVYIRFLKKMTNLPTAPKPSQEPAPVAPSTQA